MKLSITSIKQHAQAARQQQPDGSMETAYLHTADHSAGLRESFGDGDSSCGAFEENRGLNRHFLSALDTPYHDQAPRAKTVGGR